MSCEAYVVRWEAHHAAGHTWDGKPLWRVARSVYIPRCSCGWSGVKQDTFARAGRLARAHADAACRGAPASLTTPPVAGMEENRSATQT